MEPLTLSSMAPYVGQVVTAQFTLRNAGQSTVTLDELRAGARGPDCVTGGASVASEDWGCRWMDGPLKGALKDSSFPTPADKVILQPGETYAYQEKRSFDASGTGYFAGPAYKIGTEWTASHWISGHNEVLFKVTPGLRVKTPLSLSTTEPRVGDLVRAHYTLVNDSEQPRRLKRVGVTGRGPDCKPLNWGCSDNPTSPMLGDKRIPDFPMLKERVLAPGEELVYEAWRVFGRRSRSPTDYLAGPVYQDENDLWKVGTFIPDGNEVTFTVRPAVVDSRALYGVTVEIQLANGDEKSAIEANRRQLELARNQGARVVRLDLSHRLLEQWKPGDPRYVGDYRQKEDYWYVRIVDKMVEDAQAKRLKVIVLLAQTPCWRLDNPKEVSDCETAEAGTAPTPSATDASLLVWKLPASEEGRKAYAEAFSFLVERYGGKVNVLNERVVLAWEIWNEVNAGNPDGRFTGGCSPGPNVVQYADLLKPSTMHATSWWKTGDPTRRCLPVHSPAGWAHLSPSRAAFAQTCTLLSYTPR